MARCRVDESIERVVMEGFAFPLGVYPIEPMVPRPGYSSDFEPADGDDQEGDWEEWPDRYVYDIVISAERLEPLVRALLSLMPGRVYPILDVLGQDAYREIDPYISYELIGTEHITDMLRRYRGYFFEDGMCGFGAMADEPFIYVFVDEHKIVTVRVETAHKERVEKVLAAFDLEPAEAPAGADAAAHEHRGVLDAPDDRPDLRTAEEIVEQLRDEWRLVLNIDGEGNEDDEHHDLGITAWRCLVRCVEDHGSPPRYADVILTADCLRQAEELALNAAEELLPEGVDEWEEATVVASDRMLPERLADLCPGQDSAKLLKEEGIRSRRWLE